MMLSRTNHRLTSWAILVASIVIAVACAQVDWARIAENEQRSTITRLFDREASGQIHIVEVDAKSIAAAREWPWSRERHARLVRELDAAGARSVVFDIDFSSHSTSAGDAAFASAIAGAKTTVVLPTFAQTASETSERRLDALPIPALREHSILASASVRPDDDARVRRMVYGTLTEGVPRPSMSAQLAGADGAIDTSFAIDFSIDPDTIPRHSFIDIEQGRFDPASLAGKDVLVGATAIELGDRYGVPILGVIPGVTIQALAAETLLAGGLTELGWLPMLLLAALTCFGLVRLHSWPRLAGLAGGTIVALFAMEAIAYHAAMLVFDIVPAAIAIVFTTMLQVARILNEELRQRSLTDSETGLPNALAFAEQGGTADDFVATAFIKDFDSIQAALGKDQIGDFLQRLVDRMANAHPLGAAFRADTRVIAWRHSGEFETLVDAFDALRQAMRKPIEIGGRRVDVSLAFGIASGGDLAASSRAASEAAKDNRVWHAHEDAEAAIIEQRVSLMGELDEAVEKGQLRVVYQPKLKLATNRIESVEALVRWEHPLRGFMRPDHFIPLAEETDRIEPLTLFVLNRTISDLDTWCREGIVVSAAVNISAKLISSERFVSTVEHILSSTGIPRERLIFEVTESATMRDPELSARNLERFRKLGVLISMDDYGTGQSTLSYLQLLPLSELKIDRAFVQNVHKDRSDALMVRSTIQLAHSLGLRVVCEGVEEQTCLDFLKESGCDYAQGYFISKPVGPEQLAPMLPHAEQHASA